MAQSTFAADPQIAPIQTPSRSTMLAVALVSLASLLLELALTRLFSVVLFYHFAFFAISVALLGLGSGGVFAHIRQEWLARFSMRTLGRVALPAELNLYSVLGGSGAAYSGFAGSHGPQLWQAHDYLSRGGGALFPDRTCCFPCSLRDRPTISRSFTALILPEAQLPAWRLCRC